MAKQLTAIAALPAPRNVIRVLVVGGHAIIRAGLRRLLEANDGVMVCGEAASALDAARLLRVTDPDVVLVDADRVEPDPTACSRVLRGTVPVIVLIGRDDDDRLLSALRAGAAAVLSKESPPARLASTVRTLAGGAAPRPRRITRRSIGERIDSTATIVHQA
jgi:DNA-binding NarL/FixJ family response regulator